MGCILCRDFGLRYLKANTVERMMLGTETFCYRDHEGYFRIVPYRAVDQVTTTQTPEVH